MKSRFEGDGRVKIEPLPEYVYEGTIPLNVSKSQARRICDSFDIDGYSCHSAGGQVLWVILEHCATNNIPYKLSHTGGFFVERQR